MSKFNVGDRVSVVRGALIFDGVIVHIITDERLHLVGGEEVCTYVFMSDTEHHHLYEHWATECYRYAPGTYYPKGRRYFYGRDKDLTLIAPDLSRQVKRLLDNSDLT